MSLSSPFPTAIAVVSAPPALADVTVVAPFALGATEVSVSGRAVMPPEAAGTGRDRFPAMLKRTPRPGLSDDRPVTLASSN